MAGEATIAKRIIADALEAADQDANKTTEAMLFAVLTEALSELMKSRSRSDLEGFISYHLDNYDESEWVITRGC